MEILRTMETLTIAQNIFETADTQARLDIENIKSIFNTEQERKTETNAKYFDINYDGIVSLKPEYRGASRTNEYPFSISDKGLGIEGSKAKELPERIVIPQVINEIAVTGFHDGMFYRNERVKELALPYSIRKIPKAFCREARYLRSLENPKDITHVGNDAFRCTRIEKAVFPKLQQLGTCAFMRAPKLVLVNIGNSITEIPNQCFAGCDKLSAVFGGANVTSVVKYGFFGTRHLKSLSFLSQLTNIGDYAFFNSRVTFDWNSLTNCTFGTNATYIQFNDTDYWTGVEYTPCENKLGSLFHQKNPEWENFTYQSGCSNIVIAEVYSAFENIEISTPKELEEVLSSIDPALLSTNTNHITGVCQVLNALGYNTTLYDEAMTADDLREVYNALANGALLYKSTMSSTNLDGGHATLAYGINEIGELMIADSDGTGKDVHLYETYKYTTPVFAMGSKLCNIVVIEKTTSTN